MKSPVLVSILIPCLNEKNTIKRVIKNAQKYGEAVFPKQFEIVIADNGSTDGSLEVIKSFPGVKLVKVLIKGYGAALHWGITHSTGKYALFADADLSYPFSNLSSFQSILHKNPDLVLGSRLKGNIGKGAMPFLHRYLGTPLLNILINIIYKFKTSDCNSGMRLIKKSFYKKLNMKNSGMEWASELLIRTALNDGSYFEVPIKFLKDKRGKSPHLSTWSDGWRHLKAIFLLNPVSLYPIVIIFLLGGILFKEKNTEISFLMINVSFMLFLSTLSAIFLENIIEGKSSSIFSFLSKFKLVQIAILITITTLLLILLIPDGNYFKSLMGSFLSIFFMWIFLVETIKTHLVNRLNEL